LKVFICADDLSLRTHLEEIVGCYAKVPHLNINLGLSTASPHGLLQHLDAHRTKKALYILDLDIASEIDGFAFASKIRSGDTQGKIIILSTHPGLSDLIFLHKIEALDYIIKGDPDYVTLKIKRCIKTAYQRCQAYNDFFGGSYRQL